VEQQKRAETSNGTDQSSTGGECATAGDPVDALVPRDVGGDTALGFVIYPSSDQPYEVYSVHHLPELPADLGSSGTLTLTDDGGIRTDTDKAQGPRVFSFGFDEGDPLGTYKIDVYVNDRLVESASIQVVEPATK